jgi:hypothetical protein
MTTSEIIKFIKQNFPNAQDVILDEVRDRLKRHEDYIFHKVHSDAFQAGKDLGYRNGKNEGIIEGTKTERLKHLGWTKGDDNER